MFDEYAMTAPLINYTERGLFLPNVRPHDEKRHSIMNHRTPVGFVPRRLKPQDHNEDDNDRPKKRIDQDIRCREQEHVYHFP